MGSRLEALVSRQHADIEAEASERGLRALALPQDMMLIPLTQSWREGPPALGFEYLSSRVVEWATAASARTPVAYVEQWTFAGPGDQSAIVWAGGDVVFGPCFTSTEDDCEPPFIFVNRHEPTAVHRALRELGVERGDAIDEYAALGLNMKRNTEDWLA